MKRKIIPFLIILIVSVQTACNRQNEQHTQEKKQAVGQHMHSMDDSSAVCVSDGMPSRAATIAQSKIIMESLGSDNSNMVWIKGGVFKMGSNEFADSQPIHEVMLNGFWMDEHEVTNAQFARFVEATGYQTVAERALDPADFPNVSLDMLVPGSAVFTPPTEKVGLNDYLQWWKYVAGANWRHPQGPASSIDGKENYPVVQISYEDAAAYAKWAGKRLPTEAEWEYGARGMLKNTLYYWGNELKPNGKWAANVYQGDFPMKNTKEDGYEGASPVKSFASNSVGLYDMDGNVWEWCSDFYRPDYYKRSVKKNPAGPKDSFDPQEPDLVKRVQRGGSFLCNDQYCERYVAGSRGKGEVSSASDNLGFRCVSNNPPPAIKE